MAMTSNAPSPKNLSAYLKDMEATRPSLHRLAQTVALAATVDTVLLRHMRLSYVPQADSGFEADLWFSRLVDSANPQNFTFHPEAARGLWESLRCDQAFLERTWSATSRLHLDSPPIVRMTEELVWLGLTESVSRKHDRIEGLLRQVLVALVREDRLPLARWAVRTLPRLPLAVARAESFERLALEAQLRIPTAKPILSKISVKAFRDWMPGIADREFRDIDVGIRRTARRLQLTPGTNTGDFCISIPLVAPLVIGVSERHADDAASRIINLQNGSTKTIASGTGPLWIRDSRGWTYEIPPERSSFDPSKWRFDTPPSDIDPLKLGVHHYDHGISVAVFSENATKIEFCVYDGELEVVRMALPDRTDGVWNGYLKDVGEEFTYGFRASGPYEPERGQRYNPNKLLIDPYAKVISRRLTWNEAVFGYVLADTRQDLSFDVKDSASYVPMSKSMRNKEAVLRKSVSIPSDQTVLYQLHIKGMTRLHPDVAPFRQGTYAGLHSDAVVRHLKQLGVTSLMISPVHEFVDEFFLVERNLKNYFGTNPIGYFTPTSRFALQDAVAEFKEMISALHDVGFEVIVSVDYDHTCEGNELGPTLCWRGLDNTAYYSFDADKPRHYVNWSGTGNSLDHEKPAPRRMLLDSLRYWVQDMGVDGFCFRAGTVLGRTRDGFEAGAGSVLQEIKRDPILSRIKLIAEPYDIGPGGYQTGAFPPGWSEMNDRYLRTLRQFWRGERGIIGDVAMRMCGSSDRFNHSGRLPQAVVNLVTDQNGFTLTDLYSYNEKHNEANGEGNRDGQTDNQSDNCGAEGPSDDLEICALRKRLRKAQLTCLLLAHGTPMLLGGDEVGNTQAGNNNPFCQDNEIGWIGWESLGGEDDLTDFISRLIAIRREYPQLRPKKWNSGDETASDAISWFAPNGHRMTEEDWANKEATFLSYTLHHAETAPIYIAMNGGSSEIEAVAPPVKNGKAWQMLVDTAAGDRGNLTRNLISSGETFFVRPRTMLVFNGIVSSSPAL